MASKNRLRESLSSPLPQQQSPPTFVLELFKAVAKETIVSDSLSAEGLLLQLAICEESGSFADGGHISEDLAAAVMELVDQLKTDKKAFKDSLSLLLNLALLVSDWEPPSPTEEEKELEETSADESEELEDVDSTSVSSPPALLLPVLLFSKLSSALKEWQEKVGPATGISVPLLQTVRVILSAGPRSQSLPNAVTFVESHLPVLMAYSTDGYLSDNSAAFFWELLEFISSLAEQDIDPPAAIQNHLPNLFGPVFGVRSHPVSCLLLRYGYLSIGSQHRKALLGQGLHFLMQVWKLFVPLDLSRARELSRLRHLEGLRICQDVLEDVIASLPVFGAADSSETELSLQSRSIGPELSTAGEEEQLGEDGTIATRIPAETPSPVTNEERLRDKAERNQLLAGLLELACAMVSRMYVEIKKDGTMQRCTVIQEIFLLIKILCVKYLC